MRVITSWPFIIMETEENERPTIEGTMQAIKEWNENMKDFKLSKEFLEEAIRYLEKLQKEI